MFDFFQAPELSESFVSPMKDTIIPKTPKTDPKKLDDEEEKQDPEAEERQRQVKQIIEEIKEEKKDDTRTHSVIDSSPDINMVDEEEAAPRVTLNDSKFKNIVPQRLDFNVAENILDQMPARQRYEELLMNEFSTTGAGMELQIPVSYKDLRKFF